MQRVHVVQGQYHVTGDPNVMLTTLLGSCVSACMRDPITRVGGMNHFLLPDGNNASDDDKLRYGVHAMELLVNAILQIGGQRDRLEVSLFGGANVTTNFTNLGGANADFAENFVRREGLAFKGGSLRGEKPRRVQFWPALGRVRQQLLIDDPQTQVDLRIDITKLPQGNAVEFF
ncbi:MAG: chemotaxis protein CheD [Rhizobiales bacterium]|nr:chemotaxis protein CheD [Hyphomicrobiales bacterium]